MPTPTQGAQGAQGTQGKIGQGVQGTQGRQGTVGGQGAQGLLGLIGGQGVQGRQGTQGYSGGVGVQGPLGLIGGQGLQGPFGSQGTQGYTGNQGIQGIIGTGLQGTQGYQGPSNGPQGPQGTNGSQGLQGNTGVQGNTGNQGTAGTGNQGAQGASNGPQGTQGPRGYIGTQGAVGSAVLTAGTGITLTQSSGTTVISLTPPTITVTTSTVTSNTVPTLALGYTQAEVAYCIAKTASGSSTYVNNTNGVVPTSWNLTYPPGDLRRYGATCNGYINGNNQGFVGTSDDAALTTAAWMLSNYGQDVIFPSGYVVTLTSAHTITCPPNFTGRIVGYGSTIVSNYAGTLLTITPSSGSISYSSPPVMTAVSPYVAGMQIQGITFCQLNVAGATGAILVNGPAWHVTIENCAFLAWGGSTSYSAITFSENPQGTATSAPLYSRVRNCQFNTAQQTPLAANYMPKAITLIGQCNATVIESSQFSAVTHAIYFQPPNPGFTGSGTSTIWSALSNGVAITNNSFETGSNAIYVAGGTTGGRWNKGWALAGLIVTNNRAENLTTSFLNLNGFNSTTGTYATFVSGNFALMSSGIPVVINPNSLPIHTYTGATSVTTITDLV